MQKFRRTGKVFTGTYQDSPPTEEQRTDSRSVPEELLPLLKDWRSGTDMRRLAEAREGRGPKTEESEALAEPEGRGLCFSAPE